MLEDKRLQSAYCISFFYFVLLLSCILHCFIVSAASTAFSFGRSTRPTHISSTFCDGSEPGLLNCFNYRQSCHYTYDAGVSCEGQTSLIYLLLYRVYFNVKNLRV